MNTRSPWLAIAGSLIFVTMLVTALLLVTRERTLSQATSPDGRWTIVVHGSPRLLGIGGIEVTLDYYSSAGKAYSVGVVDLCNNWSQAQDRYGTISIHNHGAQVHERAISFGQRQ